MVFENSVHYVLVSFFIVRASLEDKMLTMKRPKQREVSQLEKDVADMFFRIIEIAKSTDPNRYSQYISLPDEHKVLIKSTAHNFDPVASYHDNFVWLGSDQSLTTLYVKTVLTMEIFIVTEEKFRMLFDKMPLKERIPIRKGCVSEAVYVFRELASHNVKLIARDHYLQNVMPKLFEDDMGNPIKYGTIKSRVNLPDCVKSDKRKKALDALIEDLKWENRNR